MHASFHTAASKGIQHEEQEGLQEKGALKEGRAIEKK